MTGVLCSARPVWTIAAYTWREGMRKKVLIGFLILSILVLFGAQFLTSFLTVPVAMGEQQPEDVDVQTKLIKDICITVISIFGALITIFISASVVPGEIENKVIYTVLSKPVRRFQYLLGKFLGVQLIILINLALMAGLFFVALWVKEGVTPTLLLWAIFLLYFQLLIVSAFTFAVSCAATSAVVPTILGLFIYVTGNMTDYLKDTARRAGQTDLKFDEIIGWIADGLFQVLPNLKYFSLRSQLVLLRPDDPPQGVLFSNLIVYALVFTLAGYLIAYWVFRRREM